MDRKGMEGDHKMKPLDPISARLFPTLARYVRKVKWLGLLAVAAMLFTSGLACGLVIGSYRGRVADEDYAEMRRRVVVLEAFTEAHHQRTLTTTLVQANDSAWKREVKTNGNAR